MKNFTKAAVILFVLAFASFGFTLIKENTESRAAQTSSDFTPQKQSLIHRSGAELATWD